MTASRRTLRNARLVIVGAGFAGASLLRNLPRGLRRPETTLLVDRDDHYTFAPLLHEVAVGRIHPDSVRTGIPPLCENRCSFLRTEAASVDLASKTLHTQAGDIRYEYLVLAAGGGVTRPPDGLGDHLQTFGRIEDALRLREALNRAWRIALDPARRGEAPSGVLTVAVVGGGATGVELSAEVAALFGYLWKRSYRAPAERPRVVLLEATDRLMGWLDPYFHEAAMEHLSRAGVEVRLNAHVEEASEQGVLAEGQWIPARTRVWTAGIEASRLARELPGEKDRMGRVRVDERLNLPGHPEVYVLGDASLYEDPRLGPLSPTASLAVQQGPWTARDLGRRVRGARQRPPFDFFNRGYVVSLGPENAVTDALGARFKGPAAQALYRGVLLYYQSSRRDRALTAADWAMERTLGRVGFGAAQDEPGRAKPAPAPDAVPRSGARRPA